MADGNGCVGVGEQHRHGLAHDVAAANHDRFLPLDGNLRAAEDLDHSAGSAWHQSGPPGRKIAHVERMKAIHILRGIDRQQHPLGVHLAGQGQLHQDAIDIVAEVEPGDQGQHLLGRDVFRRGYFFTEQAKRFAGFHLTAHVNLRSRIVAYQYGGEARFEAAQAQVLHLFRDFRLNGGGNSVSVQNGGWHGFAPIPESMLRP